MSTTLTPNDEAQLLQTIEMFEVITQSQPQDYQSLEILKEAYSKLDRQKDVVNTSKRIASAYTQMGQLSSAILEYESILQRFPNDPDVKAALADIEKKANSFTANTPVFETSFITKKGKPKTASEAKEVDDGRQTMQKIFVDSKNIALADFNLYWHTPNTQDTQKSGQRIVHPDFGRQGNFTAGKIAEVNLRQFAPLLSPARQI